MDTHDHTKHYLLGLVNDSSVYVVYIYCGL